ncbi:uncharacterized protein [Euphorbia lathyris]|uniref:uncharacterized protein isoform X2 n=1 Tax=Euphorbia lathyris TaxID=212925 RepID=UPI003313F8D0
MACLEIQTWTFSGLVGAFLDLAIVFLLLCASTLTYAASKFLGLFGASLPCHCNGNFGPPNSEKCWQRVLVNGPSDKISSVQFSVRSKLPFDSILDPNPNETNQEHECFGLDADASSPSIKDRSGIARDVNEESFDVKGKEVSSQKRAHALLRRRNVSTDNGRLSSVSAYDSVQLDLKDFTLSPASVNKMVKESKDGNIAPDSSGGATLHYGRYSSMDMDLVSRESSGFESNEPMDENKPTDKDVLPADDLKFDAQGELSYGCDEKNAIRFLEQALEEEHTARAALWNELEKERSASASAADEAMAMILRLQEEKASVEMEARQYQRMIEEKAAYDFEEMNILKEILLRREREKHFLEKEVETYRQIIFENEQLDADTQGVGTSLTKRASLLLYSGEDPLLMLQNISKSFGVSEKMLNANKNSEFGTTATELQDCAVSFGKELSIQEFDKVGTLKQEYSPTDSTINIFDQHFSGGDREINVDFEKMTLLPSDESPFSLERKVKNVGMDTEFKLSAAEEYDLHEKTIAYVGEVQQQNDVKDAASNSIQTCDELHNIFPYTDNDLQKDDNGTFNMDFGAHDVPVIDDNFNVCSKVGENESMKLSENVPLDIPRRCDNADTNQPQTEQESSRSCSDITSGLPPLVCSKGKPLLSDFRRKSMSAVDYERFKIDNEIGWLRERLRIVQEGREKQKMSMEHGEKDKVQLQLLENIVNQLQEIRQLTETGRAVRQVSLPPSSGIVR